MILQALVPFTPGRQWSPGASPSFSSNCWEGAEQSSVSWHLCFWVQPHWCHFGKQGTELLLTFEGKRVRTRQKEGYGVSGLLCPCWYQQDPRMEQKFHLQSNGEQNEGRQSKTGGNFPSSPTSGTVWRMSSPHGRMSLSTECSAFAGLVSAGTSGHPNLDSNLATHTSPTKDD